MSDDETVDELAAARAVRGRSGTSSPFASETSARWVECIVCKRPVELSGFAWDAAKMASQVLCDRGEAPLRNDEMTRCPECAASWQERRRKLFGAMCGKVNAAQADANDRGVVNHALVEKLREYGFGEWADGIESGAKKFHEARPNRGRGSRDTR